MSKYQPKPNPNRTALLIIGWVLMIVPMAISVAIDVWCAMAKFNPSAGLCIMLLGALFSAACMLLGYLMAYSDDNRY